MPPPLPRQAPPAITSRRQADRDALADGFIGAAIGALDKLDARLINIGRLEVDLAAKLDELGKVERKDVVLADEDADKLRFIEDERRKRGGRPGPDGGAA